MWLRIQRAGEDGRELRVIDRTCVGSRRARRPRCPPTMRWPGSGRPRRPPRGRCRPRRPRPSWRRSRRRLPSSRPTRTHQPTRRRPGGLGPGGVGLGLGRPAGRVEGATAAVLSWRRRSRSVPCSGSGGSGAGRASERALTSPTPSDRSTACGIGFVPSISAPLTWSAVNSGCLPRISAATPLTIGAANEVPESSMYPGSTTWSGALGVERGGRPEPGRPCSGPERRGPASRSRRACSRRPTRVPRRRRSSKPTCPCRSRRR